MQPQTTHTRFPATELLCRWYQQMIQITSERLRWCGKYRCGCVCCTGPSAPSCDSVCLALAIGLTVGVLVVVAIVVLVIVAYRRSRLPSSRSSTTGETYTDITGTSPHRTVIYVCIDNAAYTPESIDSVYLHLEPPIVFNEAH